MKGKDDMVDDQMRKIHSWNTRMSWIWMVMHITTNNSER